MKDLLIYLDENSIAYELKGKDILLISDKLYSFQRVPSLFSDQFDLLFFEENVNYYIFILGKRYYYTPTIKNPEFNELKYIQGAYKGVENLPFLGIHGGFELMNGSGSYESWVEKAKFLNIDTLGLCEYNTLAGLLKFQQVCLDNQIKPILGVSYDLRNKNKNIIHVKIYVKDSQGWSNLLYIHNQVQLSIDNVIDRSILKGREEGLLITVDPKKTEFSESEDFTYYQLDIPEFSSSDKNLSYLKELNKYLKSSKEPIYIQDAFYKDKQDADIKPILNTINGLTVDLSSKDQYMKDTIDFMDNFMEMFEEKDRELAFDIYLRSTENLIHETKECSFLVDTKNKFLPNYIMNETQSKVFKSSEELFYNVIQEGFDELVPEGSENLYFERLDKELSVITKGGFVDYFLILWDVIDWCNSQGVLTGIGRGSAAGSLVAYLLKITRLDPIKHNLLFERFLNESRIQNSLPDIDVDFPGSVRDNVKHYLEDKYGKDYVCSVGTYSTLQMKAAIQAMAKVYNIPIPEYRRISNIIDTDDGSEFKDLIKNAVDKDSIKDFINTYPQMFHLLPLLLKQPRSESIHASATIIVPQDRTVVERIPSKLMLLKDGEKMIVSEWEGEDLAEAGFLKEDILGIRQLDKFQDIYDETGVDIYNIPLTDKTVFEYFSRGWNSDVFHFGSKGLTKYCKQLKPQRFEDLVAGIALYRPGAMESRFHDEYVLLKEGIKPIIFYEGIEDITKDTFGLIIYQEQIMQICQKLASFSLDEADDIRRAIGKKKQKLIDSYRSTFVERSVTNGYNRNNMDELWNIMEKFAKYSFNASHAASYAKTGYISQWLKIHYPVQFWSTTFKFLFSDTKKDEKIPVFINELNHTSGIKLKGVDINFSSDEIIIDKESESMYWPLSAISQCGETSLEQIKKDRVEKGLYFSFEDFLKRHTFKGSKLNKTVIVNLIKSGAFDDIESIEDVRDRKKLIVQFNNDRKEVDKILIDVSQNDKWLWYLEQRQLSKFAQIPYQSIIDQNIGFQPFHSYKDVSDCLDNNTGNNVIVGGYVIDVIEKQTQKGKHANIIIDSNSSIIDLKFWYESYDKFESEISLMKNCIVLVSGTVTYDKYKDCNTIQIGVDNFVKVLNYGRTSSEQ